MVDARRRHAHDMCRGFGLWLQQPSCQRVCRVCYAQLRRAVWCIYVFNQNMRPKNGVLPGVIFFEVGMGCVHDRCQSACPACQPPLPPQLGLFVNALGTQHQWSSGHCLGAARELPHWLRLSVNRHLRRSNAGTAVVWPPASCRGMHSSTCGDAPQSERVCIHLDVGCQSRRALCLYLVAARGFWSPDHLQHLSGVVFCIRGSVFTSCVV